MSYNKVQDNFWINDKVRSWDFKTRMIALYLLTNQHRISEGLYRLPLSYIAEDMKLEQEEILKSVQKLINDEFIKYDSANSMVLIINALKYQPLQNINHCKAALNKLEALPSSPLLGDLIKQAAEHNPKFHQFLKEKSSKKKFLKKSFNKKKVFNLNRNNALKTKEVNSLKTKYNNSQALDQSLTPAHTQTQAQLKTKAVRNSTAALRNKDNESSELKKAAELCSYLITLILKNNSRASVPRTDLSDPLFVKWSKEIDKLHRLGPIGAKSSENKGYSYAEIKRIIKFSQQNQFWKSNILSAHKLRKQVIKLENKMKSSNFNQSKQKTNKLRELYLAAKEEELNGKK